MKASSWTLLDADARERARFATLAATLAHASELAAPANRWREVRRITADGATWYLKVFHRMQWKNALALRCTAPRARNEAEREAAMARALRAAGFDAPRVVAIGTQGRSSYFLCAALPGQSLRARLQQASAPDLLLAATRFAERALAAGFCMPDLSADHVFVQDETGDPSEPGHSKPGHTAAPVRFALLDLHNARRAAPSWKTMRRVLRHGARSLRGLPITRALAVRAALTLLRATGHADDARRMLATLPPWNTHARYEAAGKSDAYRARNPERTHRELALLARVWPGQANERVLDSPCGAGRLVAFITERHHRAIGCDRARAMLRQIDNHRVRACADAAALPFEGRSVHGVVVFRFLHHLDREAARTVVTEAARVAERWLVVSVFHPMSAHGLWRTVRGLVTRRARTRFAHAPAQVARWLAPQGFELVQTAREGVLRDLCLLTFRRAVSTR